MQVIVSHVNTDFDALASIIAAQKLYPNAKVVISTQQDNRVRQFLNIYRDTIQLSHDHEIEWEQVTDLILVDIASLNRIGQFSNQLNEEDLHITIYDHHMPSENDVKKDAGQIEQVGATVTLLIEKIKEKQLEISPLEATLFGLGIYTDTGAFTFKQTTARDFQAASYLMEQGMDLEMIQQFSEQTLQKDQQALLDTLFTEAKTIELDGLEVTVSKCYQDHFVRDLATVTSKLLEIKGADATLVVVGMKKDVFVVGRARSERISLQPILKKLGGGGHHHAGAATIKKGDYRAIYDQIQEEIELILRPAKTAKHIMTSPVKMITSDTSMEKAGQLMYRYGHSGYPVIDEDESLVGIITRRDLDKANHHSLGHAPVKAYMTTNIMTVSLDDTLEEIQQTIIDHNIGRLPVIEQGNVVGIISRTNIIKAIHGERLQDDVIDDGLEKNLKEAMKKQLSNDIYLLLIDIGKEATKQKVPVYLIGGIVRDLLLKKPNDDVDIVIEGDGIQFVKSLQTTYGGEVVVHESFGTATWVHPSGQEVDIATSRLEYYDKPASLPDVETSTLEEDLNRRDFTINAMGVYLNEDQFGEIIDPFSGQLDLHERKIKVLHNMSFVEDPTRIFRAIRFEVRFDFLMDNQTEQLALQSIEKVNELSIERIVNEMKRLFIEEDPLKVMNRLYELSFWKQFGLKQRSAKVTNNFIQRLKKLYKNNESILPNSPVTWFNIFMIPFYIEDQLIAGEQFAIKKDDATLLKEIRSLKEINLKQLNRIEEIHKYLRSFSTEAVIFNIALQSLDKEEHILNYLKKRQHLTVYITGNDLKTMKIKPGPLYSKIFFNLEIAVLAEEVASKEEALAWVNEFVVDAKESSH